MTVPHITLEQATAIWSNPIDKKESTAIFNKRIDAYNKANEQPNKGSEWYNPTSFIDKEKERQEQYITAEEARKLGAGNCLYLDADDVWRVEWRGTSEIKYRAIKQPEPVEPTCQVRNDDTGELKTMTREAAKKLQAELGDTVDWYTPVYGKWYGSSKDLLFQQVGIYTYKLRGTVKLDGELMTMGAAIAKWESKKDKWEFLVKGAGDSAFEVMKHNHHFNEYAASGCEYQLRLKPTVKLTIDDEPAKMLTPAQCEAERLARVDTHDCFGVNRFGSFAAKKPEWNNFQTTYIEYRLIRKQLKQVSWADVPELVKVQHVNTKKIFTFLGLDEGDYLRVYGKDSGDLTCRESALELAPASEQTNWIARQDNYNGEVAGLIYEWRDNGSYRITGLAEGWVLR